MGATTLNQELTKLNNLIKNPLLSDKEQLLLSETQRKEALKLYEKANLEIMLLKNKIEQLEHERSFKTILLKIIE